MNIEIQETELRLKHAKILYGQGKISFDQLKESGKEYVTLINKKGRETAKEFGRKWYDVPISKVIR